MARRQARGAPRRRTKAVLPRQQILVFVEGERTEDGYFKFWWRRHRDKVLVKIEERNGTPMTLVKLAIDQRDQEQRDERRGRGQAHDEVWCVFDRDTHPHFDDAILLAKRHGIGVAVSNPCFELWFILHYEDQTAHIEGRDAMARSAKLLGCKKVLTDAALEALATQYGDAVQRAKALDKKHRADGSQPRSNPSSEAWKLVERIVGSNDP